MPDRTRLRRGATTALTVVLVLPLLGGCGLFGDDDEGEGVSVFSIKPGQCFEGQSEVKAQLSELTEVDCDQEHAQESYAVVEFTADGVDDPTPSPATTRSRSSPTARAPASTASTSGSTTSTPSSSTPTCCPRPAAGRTTTAASSAS